MILSQTKDLLIQHRDLIKFLALALLLLILWAMILSFFPSQVQAMHYAIIKPQADVSSAILSVMGYENTQYYMINGCEALIDFGEKGNICIGSGCSGLELFILFFGFILLMRGRIKDKLWFVPLGFGIILLLNVIRIMGLSVIFYHNPKYLAFNHKYTFVIVVYGAIFGLWLIWVNRFAKKS